MSTSRLSGLTRQATQSSSTLANQRHESEPQKSSLKVPPWMYGYGLFQGSATAGDSMILFFGAMVLSLTPATVGLLDAVGSIAFAAGITLLALVINRIAGSKNLFVFSLVAVGLALFLYAAVNATPFALAIAVLFGLFLSPSAALAPIMAIRSVPRSLWSQAFSHLNQAVSLGGAIGVAGAVLWLAISPRIASPEISIRLLFVGMGVVAILGALYSSRYLMARRGGRHPTNYEDQSISLRPLTPGSLNYLRISPPLLSDQFLLYLLFSFILFSGIGMSFSGMHTYLVRDLNVSIALAMGAVLGYKIASYFVSQPSSQGMGRLLPLQVQSLTSIGRGITVALVATVALLPVSLAGPMALLLVTIWGISGGILAVTGAEATAQLAVPGRWQESMVTYIAVSNGGAIFGALMGGALAGLWGFEAVFLIAAGLITVAGALLLRS